MWVIRSAYEILVEKPERKRDSGRPGSRLKCNITMNFMDVRCESVV